MMTEVFPKVMMSQSDLQSLLLDNCTKKYCIEYNGFMSNHMSHGIIALYRLGATVEQIQRFVSSAYKAVISHSIVLFTCNKNNDCTYLSMTDHLPTNMLSTTVSKQN